MQILLQHAAALDGLKQSQAPPGGVHVVVQVHVLWLSVAPPVQVGTQFPWQSVVPGGQLLTQPLPARQCSPAGQVPPPKQQWPPGAAQPVVCATELLQHC